MIMAGQEKAAAAAAMSVLYVPSMFPKIYGKRFIKRWRVRLGNQRRDGVGAQGNALIVASVGP
jgi:hypothetical protein